MQVLHGCVIGCLHDPANFQQASSKHPALARVFWIHLLEVCWTFAGSCKHPITDVEETDKPQTLLATCCSGWRRRRRRRLCSAHHAASAATTVPGVHVERACRHAERRRSDEAWNRGFAALVGRNHPSVWCANESLQQSWGLSVDDTAAECTWPAAGKASQDVHPDSAASTAHHLCSKTWWLEDGGRGLACGRAHSPLRVKVTVTLADYCTWTCT